MFVEAVSLSAGYSHEVNLHPNREQIGVLYYPEYTHWSELQHLAQGYTFLDAKYEELGVKSEYYAVRAPSGDTVGVGCLRYGDGQAELSCLAVLPEHQRRGIGAWLLAARIRRARQVGAQALYIEHLAPTNTLADRYAKAGFVVGENSDQIAIFAPNKRAQAHPHLVCQLNPR